MKEEITMVTEKLIALIAEKIDIDPTEITADSKLTELGMDSLDIAELLMDIEDNFGVQIEVSPELVLVSDLAEKIEAAQ